MPIDFDPKVKGGMGSQDATKAQSQKDAPDASKAKMAAQKAAQKKTGQQPPKQKIRNPSRAMEKPTLMPTPDSTQFRPQLAKTAKSQLKKQVDQLKKAIHAKGKGKLSAAAEALVAASSYAMRRSRGSRRSAVDLCDAIEEEVPEFKGLAEQLETTITAEGALYEVSADGTLRACAMLITLLDPGDDEVEDATRAPSAPPEYETLSELDIRALARSTLASAFMQLAVHFPDQLDALDLTVEQAMEESVRLAEEAIDLSPRRPEGYTVIGRALLASEDPKALSEAVLALECALDVDPDYDPAFTALAAAKQAMGDITGALELVEAVLRRGSPMPHPLFLKAKLLHAQGNGPQALSALERAARQAPEAGLFHLDAADLFAALGEPDRAAHHTGEAQRLLGGAFEQLVSALSAELPSG